MPRPTGFPNADAQDDFQRARRARLLAELGRRLRRLPDDVDVALPFEEVVAALGLAGERRLGLQTVELGTVVGTVDRGREFDRHFRPTSSKGRRRWESIANAQRRGDALPPVSLYRIGELHFVRDGHHRVSVARALGERTIQGYVTEVLTRTPVGREVRLSDLAFKGLERLFYDRVPLPPDARPRIQLRDAWDYAVLAEAVEAWGFRAIQARREPLDRPTVARDWFEHEYVPVVEMLKEADLIGRRSETEAYMRVAAERYRLLRTHEWNDEVVDRLRRELSRR
ncbi:MAG: chromosome partitioning protein ParB [Actinomycetota bacterium]|nr:chromosome partitioning protein ParB [Actinomycetota bacterium]